VKKNDSGQTLIEIILALSVVVMVITGITFAITSSLKNATFSKNQNLATAYARQGMEILRTIRDRSWTTFNSLETGIGVSYFLAENTTNLDGPSPDVCAPSCSPNLGIFSRRVKIAKNSPDCTPGAENTKVTVQVKWADKECASAVFPFCHQVELVSCFTNTNVVPTP